MGMYDNFAPKETLVYPHCKIELKNEDPELPYRIVLQSKALDCCLDEYKEGESIENRERGFSIKDGWVEAYDYCKTCKKMIYFKLIIENGIWIRTESVPTKK